MMIARVAFALLVAAAPLAAPSNARACGDYGDYFRTDEARVGRLVRAHYAAYASGSAAAMLRVWSTEGRVVPRIQGCCYQPGTPIAEYAARETARPRALSFEVVSVQVQGDGASAEVRVTERGVAREERFHLARSQGRWRVASLATDAAHGPVASR